MCLVYLEDAPEHGALTTTHADKITMMDDAQDFLGLHDPLLSGLNSAEPNNEESGLFPDSARARLLLQDAQQLALASNMQRALEMVCLFARRHTKALWSAAWTLNSTGSVDAGAVNGIEKMPEDLPSLVGTQATAVQWKHGIYEKDPLVGTPIVLGEDIIGGIALQMEGQDASAEDLLLLDFLAALYAISRGHRSQVGEQQQKAQAAVSAKKHQEDFLSMVSHDVRNPLSTIQGYAQMLMQMGDNIDPAQQMQFLETIDKQSKRIERLVNGLLDVTRSETGTLNLQIARYDICEIVRRTASLVDTQGIYTLDLPQEPLYTLIDPLRIEQVLANLVSNALKYGRAPYGLHLCKISQEAWRLEVIDSGDGLPKEIEDNLFQRFVPGARSIGLGMSIAQAFVLAHDGTIQYKRQDGKSIFYIEIPFQSKG